MNWSAIAALAGIAGVMCTVGFWIFFGGALNQRVDDHGRRLDGQDRTIGSHAELIATHDSQIARLEGWKEGYKAGSHGAGSGD